MCSQVLCTEPYTEVLGIDVGPPPKWLSGNIGEVIKKSAYHYYIDNARVYGKLFKVGPSQPLQLAISDCTLTESCNLEACADLCLLQYYVSKPSCPLTPTLTCQK